MHYDIARFFGERGGKSVAHTPQCFTFVQRDVIGFVALNLVLRIFLARVMNVAFVVHIARVHPNNTAADPARFRVPSDVVANVECCLHGVIFVALKERSLHK